MRGGDITFARLKRIYTYLKACINTAVKHYKLIDRFELEHFSFNRKINEKVNPPKIEGSIPDDIWTLLVYLSGRGKLPYPAKLINIMEKVFIKR